MVSINSLVAGLLSSCRQVLKTETVKLHVAVLPEVSVAVQVTVVVPTGRADPEGGEQLVVTPGQLSAAVGEYVTIFEVAMGHATAVTVVMLAGQVIEGA